MGEEDIPVNISTARAEVENMNVLYKDYYYVVGCFVINLLKIYKILLILL